MQEKLPTVGSDHQHIDIEPEDLMAIVGIVADEARRYRLSTAHHTLDDYRELMDVEPAELKDLSFWSEGPDVHLWIGPHGLHVRAEKATTVSEGIVHRVDREMKRRAKPWGRLRRMRMWLGFGAGALLSLLGLVFVLLGAAYSISSLWIASLGALVGALWIYVRAWPPGRVDRLIEIPSGKVRESFWARNRDEIILRLLSGLVGFVLGWASRAFAGS